MTTNSDLDTIIEQVKQEFRNLLIKRRELITRLGNAFESAVSNPESVCEEIKNSLQEEITDKIISARDIERYCPDKWKKKTKPKNDKLSFSEPIRRKSQAEIALTTDGKSASYDEPITTKTSTIDDSSYVGVAKKLPPDRLDQQIHSGKECPACEELYAENQELKEAIRRTTALQTADQIAETAFVFLIPKENYKMVRDAMDKSKDSICVTCDESRTLVRAQPDVYN
jgi:hypothetical protein